MKPTPRIRMVKAAIPDARNVRMRSDNFRRYALKFGHGAWKLTSAEMRGVWRFIVWAQRYINAHNYSDIRDGKPINAIRHHDIVKERRVIAGVWVSAITIALWWASKNYGTHILAVPTLIMMTVFAAWGKEGPIVDSSIGLGIGLSETGIQAAVAVNVLGANLDKTPDAWKLVSVVKGLRQDGETLRISLRLPGGNPGSLAQTRREKIAAALDLQVRQVIVSVDPMKRNASEFELSIHPDTPWAEIVKSNIDLSKPTSFWDPIPFGVDINNRQVSIELMYKAMLIGGLPDMGKTTAAMNFLMHAMRDPWVRLWAADAKGVDFPGMTPLCWRFVGNSQEDMMSMLLELYRVGEAKLERLRELGERKLTRELQNREINSEIITPLCFVDVLFVDELRYFTDNNTDRKLSKQITDQLSRVVEVFRAAGIIVVCATQRPHSDVVDTSLRDLIRVRAALATTTWQASDAILGGSAYKMGYSSTEFEGHDKGVLWLRELKNFSQVRAYNVEPDEFNAACRAAFELRNAAGTMPDQVNEALTPFTPPFLALLREVILREGQGKLPTKEIISSPEFSEYTADTLGREARRHHLTSNEVGPWGDRVRVRGYRLDDIAEAVAECAKDPAFKPGIRGVV